MRRVIAAAALAALLATAAACGGDSKDARPERLHFVLHDVTYQQAQEGQEYILLWGDLSNRHLSDKVNALHQHRLGFAFRRPKKRLLRADEAKRKDFVAEYAGLREEARRTEAKIFFADEAHFQADAELRVKCVLKGRPTNVYGRQNRLRALARGPVIPNAVIPLRRCKPMPWG